MPKAHIYKTNGNYNDNVPVTMNADGSQLISYPAPSDISSASAPCLSPTDISSTDGE